MWSDRCLKRTHTEPFVREPIHATIGGKIIDHDKTAALREDVTAKCYGRDITRKKKLLEKPKKGKARMREYSNVSIPQEAFIAALGMGEE